MATKIANRRVADLNPSGGLGPILIVTPPSVRQAGYMLRALLISACVGTGSCTQEPHLDRAALEAAMHLEADRHSYAVIRIQFDDCRDFQDRLAVEYGVAAVVSTDVGAVRIVQLPTPLGNMRVTCSAPDGQMVATRGPDISLTG